MSSNLEVYQAVSTILKDLEPYNLSADVITSALYFIASSKDPEQQILQALDFAMAEWVK